MTAPGPEFLPRQVSPPNGELRRYDQLIVVRNPGSEFGSSNSIKNDSDIIASDTEVVRMESAPNIDDMSERLQKALTKAPRSAIISKGGDGTANIVLSSLIALRSKAPVLLIPDGNACDLVAVAYSRAYVKDPLALIFMDRPLPLRPLQIDATDDEGVTRRSLGMGYHSVGLSARVANELNDQEYRRTVPRAPVKRFKKEYDVTRRTIAEAHTLAITDDLGTRTIAERTTFNGPRMAKAIPGRARFFDDVASTLELGPMQGQPSFLRGLGKVAFGHRQKLTYGDVIEYSVSADGTFFSQSDGETVEHTTPTRFRVAHSDSVVYLFTDH